MSGRGWGGSNVAPEIRRERRERFRFEMLREIVAHEGEFVVVDRDEGVAVRALLKAKLIEPTGEVDPRGRTKYVATEAGRQEVAA